MGEGDGGALMIFIYGIFGVIHYQSLSTSTECSSTFVGPQHQHPYPFTLSR